MRLLLIIDNRGYFNAPNSIVPQKVPMRNGAGKTWSWHPAGGWATGRCWFGGGLLRVSALLLC